MQRRQLKKGDDDARLMTDNTRSQTRGAYPTLNMPYQRTQFMLASKLIMSYSAKIPPTFTHNRQAVTTTKVAISIDAASVPRLDSEAGSLSSYSS